jgi:hypothetical protein
MAAHLVPDTLAPLLSHGLQGAVAYAPFPQGQFETDPLSLSGRLPSPTLNTGVFWSVELKTPLVRRAKERA